MLLAAVLAETLRPPATPDGLEDVAEPIEDDASGAQPWWMDLVERHWFRVLFWLVVGLLGVAAFLLLSNFRVVAGNVYFGSSQSLGAHVTVDATAGFQDSGVTVKAGEVLRLHPQGRVHVAMDHAANLARAAKRIIVHRSGAEFADHIRSLYPEPDYADQPVFYRDWSGPRGETVGSDLLEETKLKKESPWGALLVVVIDGEVSPRADPFEVLKTNNLTPQHLVPVEGNTEFESPRDGNLVFIVNEAVLSPHSPSEDSKLYYAALKKEASNLTRHPTHRIPIQAIPLIWYADNNGTFRILVEH